MAGQTTGLALAGPSLARRLRAFWRRIEPGYSFDRSSSVERWDGCGEGRATSLCFEGFGLSFALAIGRTPPFGSGRDDEHTAEMVRWYNGEGR